MKAADLALLALLLWCGLGVVDQVAPRAQSPPATGLHTGP
jgi:hypothetical protein